VLWPTARAEFANRAWQEYTGARHQNYRLGLDATISLTTFKIIQEWTVATAAGKPFEIEGPAYGVRRRISVVCDQKGLWPSPEIRLESASLRALIGCEDIHDANRHRKVQQASNDGKRAFENSAIGIMMRDRADRFFAATGLPDIWDTTESELYSAVPT